MAAITRVYTLALVAEMLGEDADWLHDICIEMEPEDGVISVYGTNDECSPAFTDFGIENLQDVIREHRENPEPDTETPTG